MWEWANVLVIGAILANGRANHRCDRGVMGCSNEKPFQNDHCVLNRAKWSSRELSRRLLVLLVSLLVPEQEPLILGIDETIERRRGRKIAAREASRDPVRSRKELLVKTNGLRWICLMLLTPLPWAQQVGAGPIATLSREASPTAQNHHRLGLAGDCTGRRLVIAADGTSAVLDFLLQISRLPKVSVIPRLRLDARLSNPALERSSGKRGRTALKGNAQPKLAVRLTDRSTQWQKHTLFWYAGTTRGMEMATGTAWWSSSPIPPVVIRWGLIRDPAGQDEPMALLCTNQEAEAVQMVEWCVLRWAGEVTFHEVRTQLGVETQRHWSDVAILRTTPADTRACFLWSLFLRSSCWMANRFPHVRLPGLTTPCHPLPRRWLLFVSISGPPPFFRCHPALATPFTFHGRFLIAWWRRSLLRPNLDKHSHTFGESLPQVVQTSLQRCDAHPSACPFFPGVSRQTAESFVKLLRLCAL